MARPPECSSSSSSIPAPTLSPSRLVLPHLTRPSFRLQAAVRHAQHSVGKHHKEESVKIQINIKIKKRLKENQPP